MHRFEGVGPPQFLAAMILSVFRSRFSRQPNNGDSRRVNEELNEIYIFIRTTFPCTAAITFWLPPHGFFRSSAE